MTSQPPLLDNAGSMLPGPQFIPRPGWGGRLNRWLSHNVYTLVFRTVIVIALVFVARSLLVNRQSPVVISTDTPTPASQSSHPITVKARSGDGMTNLAARAVDLYMALQSATIHLDGGQHLFIVDALARTAGWYPLAVDQEVTFLPADIESFIDQAQKLTPSQRSAWMVHSR